MRKEEIKELIRLVEESGINELEVTEGRRRIRISKGAGGASVASSPNPGFHADPTGGPLANPSADAAEEKLASNLKQITSPMVGTFYRSPAPGSDPFVDIGQAVAVGQTVCIVEAMKLMNEIGSDFGGVVRQILIENAQPVEYGQPLFLVEIK
ncbi:MAG: acetyl-CoA carboxylase biotin carboxyl carrier protein [Candidatus Krumholzibacteriota bacterium]|nr:acetyl-CoA carboxylase biotin carboxyl carrier protein [Candidatus Krumholzibacteriota bacterium]